MLGMSHNSSFDERMDRLEEQLRALHRADPACAAPACAEWTPVPLSPKAFRLSIASGRLRTRLPEHLPNALGRTAGRGALLELAARSWSPNRERRPTAASVARTPRSASPAVPLDLADVASLEDTRRIASLERRLSAERCAAGWCPSALEGMGTVESKLENQQARKLGAVERQLSRERLHSEWLRSVNQRLRVQHVPLQSRENTTRRSAERRIELYRDYHEDFASYFSQLRQFPEHGACSEELDCETMSGHGVGWRRRLAHERRPRTAPSKLSSLQAAAALSDARKGLRVRSAAQQHGTVNSEECIFRRGTLGAWRRRKAQLADDAEISALLGPQVLA